MKKITVDFKITTQKITDAISFIAISVMQGIIRDDRKELIQCIHEIVEMVNIPAAKYINWDKLSNDAMDCILAMKVDEIQAMFRPIIDNECAISVLAEGHNITISAVHVDLHGTGIAMNMAATVPLPIAVDEIAHFIENRSTIFDGGRLGKALVKLFPGLASKTVGRVVTTALEAIGATDIEVEVS